MPIFPTGLKSTPGGPTSGTDYYWDVFKHLLLPVATLTASLLAQYTVIMRTNLLDVLGEDYITTGRAIGLSRRRVMRQHAVPNALLPVVTLIALNIGFVLSGAFVIESIFSWPGIGDSHHQRDRRQGLPGAAGRVPHLVRGRDPRQLRRRHHATATSTRA